MQKLLHLWRSALMILLLLTVCPAAWGATGTFFGTVTVAGTTTTLPGITVTARSETSGAVSSAVTSSSGVYRMTVPADLYTISCSPTGYTPFTKTGVSLPDGKTVRINIALVAVAPLFNHSGKISKYEGPVTCLVCHSVSATGTDLLSDVFASAHFQVRGTNPLVYMPGGGAHGMADRACGIPGTSLLAGNFASIAVAADGSQAPDGCGKCHIAYRPPLAYLTPADATNDIDCLICHARVYGAEWDDPAMVTLYGVNPETHSRTVVPAADSFVWSQDRSLRTAQSVGDATAATACLRCHNDNMTGHKRSTPFDAANDTHAFRGFSCTRCHTTARHKIPRGNYVTDMAANEQTTTEMSCTKCHGPAPHIAANAADLNKHTANVACEVCHIPTMDTEHNIGTRSWAPFTLDPRTGEWAATPVSQSASFYSPYTVYIPPGTEPTVRWFNGKASMLAQPSGSYWDRKSIGGSSQLFALKSFVNGMLFDAGWLPGPPESFDNVNSTWPYSMKAYYENNWATFLKSGFVDSAYPTAQSFWNARPDMARMLNNFPMMLYMHRATFMAEAGNVVGTPAPGPQTGATYPGIAKAIDMGMGRIGIDMGYFPADSDPATVGRNLWSGTFFGMWVPVNMDPFSPFKGELTSFITMSHGIKGAATLGTTTGSCYKCHYSSVEYAAGVPLSKRVDFRLLGWPNMDSNPIVDPLYDAAVTASLPAVNSIVFKYVSTKATQTLKISTYIVDSVDRTPLANVTVTGTLTGPAGQPGLPFTTSAVTDTTGVASVTFAQKSIAAGTYTWTVTSLTSGGVTHAVNQSNTFIK